MITKNQCSNDEEETKCIMKTAAKIITNNKGILLMHQLSKHWWNYSIKGFWIFPKQCCSFYTDYSDLGKYREANIFETCSCRRCQAKCCDCSITEFTGQMHHHLGSRFLAFVVHMKRSKYLNKVLLLPNEVLLLFQKVNLCRTPLIMLTTTYGLLMDMVSFTGWLWLPL